MRLVAASSSKAGRLFHLRGPDLPIRASTNHGDLHAYALSGADWAVLKGDYRRLALYMPCCGAPGIPKTSSRGTQFFAHARRDECKTGDESAEHLYCKSVVAAAAADAGWTVTTERPGTDPDGEDWIADVFCEKGAAKIALEIQLSPQTPSETVRRQKRYRSSGVRGAWFFGSKASSSVPPASRDIPAFSLAPFVSGEIPSLSGFSVGLPEFVASMLQGRLTWVLPRLSRPHLVEYVTDTCWACKQPVRQVLDHLPGGNQLDGDPLHPEDFYAGRWIPVAHTAPALSQRLEAIRSNIENDDLAAQGLNTIGRKDVINGKPTRFPYCNFCLHCRAPQNNHFVGRRVLEVERARLGAGDDPDTEAAGIIGVMEIPREIAGAGRWELAPGDPAGRA